MNYTTDLEDWNRISARYAESIEAEGDILEKPALRRRE